MDNVTIGNITGTGIAVGAGASASVGAPAQQDELRAALREVRDLLAPLVFEDDADAAAANDFAALLQEERTATRPRLAEIGASGLLAAAANLAATIPALLPLVQRVVELVKR
jgi:hypothetical protein